MAAEGHVGLWRDVGGGADVAEPGGVRGCWVFRGDRALSRGARFLISQVRVSEKMGAGAVAG